MKCQEFRENLPTFISEQLDDSLRLQCETHITSCVECLDLWLNNFSNQYHLETESGEELVNSILQSTNSDTCTDAKDLLVDYVDETLSPINNEMLSLHLKNCASCNSTAVMLRQLKIDLPQLSLRNPPADLLENILKQTLPWPQRLIRKISTSHFDFSNLLYRPRFSFEASFLGTVFWLAVFGLPNNNSTFALSEIYRFSPDAIPTISAEVSISNFQQSLRVDEFQLPPLVVSRIDTLKNFSAQLIETGVNKTRQGSDELWQTLIKVLPQNFSEAQLMSNQKQLYSLFKEIRHE